MLTTVTIHLERRYYQLRKFPYKKIQETPLFQTLSYSINQTVIPLLIIW